MFKLATCASATDAKIKVMMKVHVKRRQRFVVERVFLSCSLVGFVSAVFNCCSYWFILQGEKIRRELSAANSLQIF